MELVEKFCERAMLIDGGHLVDEGGPREVIPHYLELVGHLPEMAV
jgi:ABC-type polysaccharide/polyol phosphate transport system ATPase subunit